MLSVNVHSHHLKCIIVLFFFLLLRRMIYPKHFGSNRCSNFHNGFWRYSISVFLRGCNDYMNHASFSWVNSVRIILYFIYDKEWKKIKNEKKKMMKKWNNKRKKKKTYHSNIEIVYLNLFGSKFSSLINSNIIFWSKNLQWNYNDGFLQFGDCSKRIPKRKLVMRVSNSTSR